MTTTWLWIGFIVLVFSMLALDLGVLNKKDHVIGTREALGWTVFWIALSLFFNAGIFFMYEHDWLGIAGDEKTSGRDAALQFFTGYVIEKSLSLDNIFVIALIFSYFKVPLQYQHRTLFWGVLGALIMRGAMIGAGTALISAFSWTVYVFGAFLLFTAVKMLRASHEELNPEENVLVRWAHRVYRVTDGFRGNSFFVVEDGKKAITPLFLVLLVVESSDVIFAVDSIPAIFAVTHDPYIVFTSNIFAILGLRSLYFALASLLDKFRYLKESLVLVLGFVGVKMMLSHHVHIPALLSLAVIVGILGIGVVASVLRRKGTETKQDVSLEPRKEDEIA